VCVRGRAKIKVGVRGYLVVRDRDRSVWPTQAFDISELRRPAGEWHGGGRATTARLGMLVMGSEWQVMARDD